MPSQAPVAFDSAYNYAEEFLVALIHLCDHIDTGAMQMPPESRLRFVLALEHLRTTRKTEFKLAIDGRRINPVYVLHEALTACRDVPHADKWPQLAFLQSEDAQLWERLGAALSDAHAALSHNQYRAATVVSVYVMESLLGYWLHRQRNAGKSNKIDFELTKKIEQAQTTGLFSADASVSKYDKPEIECLFQSCTQAAAYRNLIHPDKNIRTGADHDQGTALFSLGTVLKLARRMGADLDRPAKQAAPPA